MIKYMLDKLLGNPKQSNDRELKKARIELGFAIQDPRTKYGDIAAIERVKTAKENVKRLEKEAEDD